MPKLSILATSFVRLCLSNIPFNLFTLFEPSDSSNKHNSCQAVVLFYYDFVLRKTHVSKPKLNMYFLSCFLKL